ncbi:lipase family protein [Persephonella sp.]
MKKIISMLFIVFSIILFAGCDNNDANQQTSTFIEAQEIGTLDKDTVNLLLQASGIDTTGKTIFGIKAYRITYWTHDEHGNKIKASGLLTVPDTTNSLNSNLQNLYSFPIVSDQHGTIFSDSEAPTNAFISDLQALGNNGTPSSSAFNAVLPYTGLLGFGAVMPDYIGYGESKDHYHPYMLRKSLANATVDLIKAVLDFCETNGYPVKREVYLAGYSEGGYATMAAAKEIQEKLSNVLYLKGVVPMGGVYDLEKIGLGIVTTDPMVYPPFPAYVLYAYAETYDSINLSDFVTDPFVNQLSSLFDKTKDGTTIYGTMFALVNKTPGTDFSLYDLFKASTINDFLINEKNPFRSALRENKVDDWVPTMKMVFIHCAGDNILPQSLAYETYQKFVNNGATDVQFIDPEQEYPSLVDSDGWNHSECAPYAYRILLGWLCVQEYGADRCS